MVSSSASCNKNLWENPHNLRMKKELPIALTLLAFGAWCCLQFPAQRTDAKPIGAVESRYANNKLIEDSVVRASWQSPVVGDSIEQESVTQPQADSTALAADLVGNDSSEQNSQLSTISEADAYGSLPHHAVASDELRTFSPAEFLQIAASPDINATAAIQGIADGLARTPAFATHTEINSALFGVSMAAKGKYFQTAGGLKSRMEIQCYSPLAQTVLQMSDGRFVYILKSNHQEQRLEFIDLFRLGNHRGRAKGAMLPTTWVMGGGMGQAISHYAQAFDFRPVASSVEVSSSTNVMTFRGIWKAEKLLHLIYAGTPVEDRPDKVVWSDVPRQLPHAIEISFAITAGQASVPKQISFFQFQTEKERSSAKEMVRIEFSPFEFQTSLPDELFTLESTDFEAVDMTRTYNTRILKLSEGMDKVANSPVSSSDLR